MTARRPWVMGVPGSSSTATPHLTHTHTHTHLWAWTDPGSTRSRILCLSYLASKHVGSCSSWSTNKIEPGQVVCPSVSYKRSKHSIYQLTLDVFFFFGLSPLSPLFKGFLALGDLFSTSASSPGHGIPERGPSSPGFWRTTVP